jgi:hypothetical protein
MALIAIVVPHALWVARGSICNTVDPQGNQESYFGCKTQNPFV